MADIHVTQELLDAAKAASAKKATGAVAKAQGKVPVARIVATGQAGVDPSTMGIGPVPATEKLLAEHDPFEKL